MGKILYKEKMMKKTFRLISLFSVIFMIIVPVMAGDGWELVKEKNNVKVYSRPYKGSKYKELKAIGIADVAFEVGVEIIKDYNRYHEWYGMCEALELVKKFDDKNYNMYFILDMPFPVTNRDVVVKVKTDWDYKKGKAVVSLESIDDNYKKEEGLVRMPKIQAKFTMTRLGPKKSELVYQLHADLGGSLSPWAANVGAKKHPYETEVGVQEQLKKPEYAQRASKLFGKKFEALK